MNKNDLTEFRTPYFWEKTPVKYIYSKKRYYWNQQNIFTFILVLKIPNILPLLISGPEVVSRGVPSPP
jgi:hypothetical protein